MSTKTKTKKAMRQRPLFKGGFIRAIDDAAENYDDAKLSRVDATNDEHATHDTLMELMAKHKLTRYETSSGLIVVATSRTKCTTKKKKDEPRKD